MINDISYGDNDVKNIKVQLRTERERRYSAKAGTTALKASKSRSYAATRCAAMI
jgi:hypothetical protein